MKRYLLFTDLKNGVFGEGIMVASEKVEDIKLISTKRKMVKAAIGDFAKRRNIDLEKCSKEFIKEMEQSIYRNIREDSIDTIKNQADYFKVELKEIVPIVKEKAEMFNVNMRMKKYGAAVTMTIETELMEAYKTKVKEMQCFKIFIRKDNRGYYTLTEGFSGMTIAIAHAKKEIENELSKCVKSIDGIKKQISELENVNPSLINTEEYLIDLKIIEPKTEKKESGESKVKTKTKEKLDITFITENKESKKNIREFLRKVRYADDYEIIITNYHEEEDNEYTNDIEIQLHEDGEYKDAIMVETQKVEDLKNDWWETVEYFDKKCEPIKKKLYKWISEEYENVKIEKGYWA